MAAENLIYKLSHLCAAFLKSLTGDSDPAGLPPVRFHLYKKTTADDVIGIPDDLVIEILLRVSPGHVYKFRRLSKFYRDVIASDDFIRRRCDLWNKTRLNFTIGDREYQVDFASGNKPKLTVRSLIIIPNFEVKVDYLVGFCRGILCYTIKEPKSTSRSTYRSTLLAFWNPLTGAHWKSSAVVYDRRLTGAFRGRRSGGVYDLIDDRNILGYDSATDDLKVLKIMKYWDRVREYYEFLVYSSKTDSWRRPKEGMHKDVIHISMPFDLWNDDQVYVEGTNCIHVVATDFDGCRKVLGFDCANETLDLISIPEQCNRKKKIALSSMDDCLCVCDKFSRGCLDVWMMDGYGVERCWVRVFSLKPGSGGYWVRVFSLKPGGGLWHPNPTQTPCVIR